MVYSDSQNLNYSSVVTGINIYKAEYATFANFPNMTRKPYHFRACLSILGLLAFTLFEPTKAIAASIENPSSKDLDSTKIHKLYMDGDFEPAIDMLESALRVNPRLSHEDSVFIFKHLGVMYAATYETREKGKMYMFKLLMVEPTAKIMDMYASDMIYMIFKNIQDEFATNRMRFGPADSGTVQSPSVNPIPTQTKPSTTALKTGMWIGGAVVVLGIGTWLLVAVLSNSSSSHHTL